MEIEEIIKNYDRITMNEQVSCAVLTNRDELFIVPAQSSHFLQFSLNPFSQIRKFQYSQAVPKTIKEIWYVESRNALIIQSIYKDKDGKVHSQFTLLLNWDKTDVFVELPSSQNSQGNINYGITDNNNDEFKSYLIPCFSGQNSYSSTINISGSSVLIIHDKSIEIWEFGEIIKLRAYLIFPYAAKKHILDVNGDIISLIFENINYIFKIEEKINNQQFSIDSKAYEYSQNNNISGTKYGYFSIIHPLQQFQQHLIFLRCMDQIPVNPNETYNSIKFISDSSYIINSSQCVYYHSISREKILPGKLCDDQNMIQSILTKDFLLLSRDNKLVIYPNPEKSGTEFRIARIFLPLQTKPLAGMQHIMANENRIIIILSGSNGILFNYPYMLKNIEECSLKAIRTQTKENLNFAVNCAYLGFNQISNAELNDNTNRATSLALFAAAINSGNLDEPKRETIIAEVKQYPSDKRFSFFSIINLRASDIDSDIHKDLIRDLHYFGTELKYIKARKFTSFDGSILLQAYERRGTNEAKEILKNIDDETFKLLDDSDLEYIANDMKPSVLVRMHKESMIYTWSKNEKTASYSYYINDIPQVINVASQSMQEMWHFDQWPNVPNFCDFFSTVSIIQFLTQLLFDNEMKTVPSSINDLYELVQNTKKRKFDEVIPKLKCPLMKFIIDITKNENDCIEIINQIKDDSAILFAKNKLLHSIDPMRRSDFDPDFVMLDAINKLGSSYDTLFLQLSNMSD